jgi:1-acyl-sn-glycerol-3-phosphate acyltransferase
MNIPLALNPRPVSVREFVPDSHTRSTAFDHARRFWYAFRRWWWAGYWGLEVAGLENVPRRGPVVLCSNHVSHLDAPAILAALPRGMALRTFTAAARDVWGERPLRDLIGRLTTNALPLSRDSAGFARGLRDLESVLAARMPLILFPEGRRSADGELLEFKPGAAMLAVRTGAPIVPVYIDGALKALPRKTWLPKPARVTVRFGEPIDPRPFRRAIADGSTNKRDAYARLTERLRAAVAALAPAGIE